MYWVYAAAFAAVVVVAAVVLPRRHGSGPRAFPWFWVAFPFTCLAVAAGIVHLGPALLWEMNVGPERYQFLDNPPRDPFTLFNRSVTAWPLLAVVGAVASVWSWRKGRT